MKNIVIINGHPDPESFCHALAQEYQKGAQSTDANCELVNLSQLAFSPILKYGYRKRTELEPDLKHTWDLILAADHLVFVYPNWWGTYPALLKGFIDRLFLPGFAFEYQERSPFPKQLLTGKTARIIVTTDTPAWYYALVYRSPGHHSMKKSILGFCGIKRVKISTFGAIRNSTSAQRKSWLSKVEQLGRKQR
ncbi:MAG: NAD(P)H-dependent oxidoreductase [Flavobacteriales bacterium]|jgi:putative NADPH-quinone reductase|nr:NAD(P)H-dependent oxidoreductase [Flavobacteriales bacterium]